MRPLHLIFLACLLAASRLAGAQTLDQANTLLENKDYEKARVALEKLVTQGNVDAEFKLGEMYLRPIGITRNKERGLALYQTAANKNHPGAQFALAAEYDRGVLVNADKKRAVSLYRTSARLKNPDAQYVLCVEQGTEGSAFYDAQEAYAWCETAAGKKIKDASDAARRAKELLKKIEGGKAPTDQAVQLAKSRAAKYIKAY